MLSHVVRRTGGALRAVRSRSAATFRGPYQSPERLTSDMSVTMKAGIVVVLGGAVLLLATQGAPTTSKSIKINAMDVISSTS